MKRPITYYGDPGLRVKAKPVEKITPEIESIVADMIETMLSYDNAIGFAATQLGIDLRIFVIREEIETSKGKISFKEPEVIINPILTNPSPEMESMVEGCMSIPGFQCEVVRPSTIHVKYQNLKGQWIEEDLTDFRARMFMHENDHLNGVLIVDRMTAKDKKKFDAILKNLRKKYHS